MCGTLRDGLWRLTMASRLTVTRGEQVRIETQRLGVDDSWLAAYRAANADLLKIEPDFARWLADEYVPIAGGWQY